MRASHLVIARFNESVFSLFQAAEREFRIRKVLVRYRAVRAYGLTAGNIILPLICRRIEFLQLEFDSFHILGCQCHIALDFL